MTEQAREGHKRDEELSSTDTTLQEQQQPLISAREVVKKFGGVVAVKRVSLDIHEGTITSIVGGNGAGKSTFVKIISGDILPTDGTVLFQGEELPLGDPRGVSQLGIETIYQDLALAEDLDVKDNVFLGRELYKRRLGLKILDVDRMLEEAAELLNKLNVKIPNLSTSIRYLSGGQRQAVSISRAIYWNARVVIMDEPTAALGVEETDRVKKLIQDLRDQGVTIILISHEMTDVIEMSDRIAVFFQGSCVADVARADVTVEELAQYIIAGGTGGEKGYVV